MRKFLTLISACAVLATSATMAGASTEKLTAADVAPYLHRQRMVDAGGHTLNVYCTGHGSPAVILDAGEGDTMSTWRKIQPRIARFTRVCSFDRAGMGFSQGGPLPRDANAMTGDLHAMLSRSGVPAPYVLVGHSSGGMYSLLYADRYREQVAGMVLVDPSFPDQTQALEAASPTMKHFDASAPDAYHLCYEAALHHAFGDGSDTYAICGFPAHAAAAARAQCIANGPAFCAMQTVQIAQLRQPYFWLDLGSEDQCDDRSDSEEILKAQRSYGSMPLIVLTAANDDGEPSPIPPAEMRAIQRVWTAGHDRLARLSSVGVDFTIHRTGHYIQVQQPAEVVSAIAEVVSQVRR